MRQQDIGRTKFRYHLNDLVFECLFFADTAPFELVMGCLGHNFAIFVDVRPGFEISPYIEPKETFFALRDALFQGQGSDHRFDPVAFFAEFNRHIPSHAAPGQTPTPDDVVRWSRILRMRTNAFFAAGWTTTSKAIRFQSRIWPRPAACWGNEPMISHNVATKVPAGRMSNLKPLRFLCPSSSAASRAYMVTTCDHLPELQL